MWPFVLVGGLVKVACMGVAYGYATTTGHEPRNISTPVTVLAVGAGLAWYSYRVDRPMQLGEMVKFAVGTALVDLALSSVILVGPIVRAGENISMRNLDLVLGGDGTGLTTADIVPLGMVFLFSMLMVFAISMFFAWITTRRLPRGRKEGQAHPPGGDV